MLQMGAFEDIAVQKISALKYIKLGTKPDLLEIKDFSVVNESDLDSAIEEITLRLNRQVEALLLSDRLAMSARVLPNLKQIFVGDYDHLARTNEWSMIDGEEE